jgi:IclR family pca regulon transcriptional regulator
MELEPMTDATITARERLERELDRVAADGFALVDQELEVGLRAIAVPIRDTEGAVVAAMNLSIHAATMDPDAMRARLLPALRETAAAVERDLALARA